MEKPSLLSRAKRAWNVFLGRDPTRGYTNYGESYYSRPDRTNLTPGNERSIITSVYNRIAMDAAAIEIKHVRLDENGRYVETIDSSLNNCLTVEANIDQTGRAFVQDVVLSMLDEGCVAIVPVDTDDNPDETGSYSIETMRAGKVIEWFPRNVRVRLYNDRTGKKEEIVVPKPTVSIVENPLYAVMNSPNSTLRRLIRKLNLLDAVDEQSSSGKLDLIIQLPYLIKTEARRQQAEQRRKDIETQLSGSKYGIAYTDGTERITQLNRPIENNLMHQIEYLTSMLLSQLGFTQGILDGSADDKTMLNYYNRTIEPILSAIVDEMKRKFLTKTARSQRQSIKFFRDPFKLVPVSDLAEISDKMTRNEIMTSNEIRQIIGLRPSSDPNADQLRNKNLNQSAEAEAEQVPAEGGDEMTEQDVNQSIQDSKDIDSQLDELRSQLGHSAMDDDVLQHYASEYYDPVKAHEYYMKNRELKGRTSTSGLNDKGREAASYIKKQINAERDAKIAADKEKSNETVKGLGEARKADIDAANQQLKTTVEQLNASKKSQVENAKNQMQSQVDSLRDALKGMDKEAKAANREMILARIASLRETNAAFREKVSEDTRSAISEQRNSTKGYKEQVSESTRDAVSSERERHKTAKEEIRNEAEEKYANEIAKLHDEGSFKAVSKKKRR